MLSSHMTYTAANGVVWTIEERKYGGGHVEYTMITPDGTRIAVNAKWHNGRAQQ